MLAGEKDLLIPHRDRAVFEAPRALGTVVAHAPPARVAWARQVCLAMLVTAAVVAPRSWLIARSHTETWDEPYHFSNGLMCFTRQLAEMELNDPPLGKAIFALPAFVAGCRPDVVHQSLGFYSQPINPETIRALVATWKALLFVGFVGLTFELVRRLYGLRSAWLAALLLTVEPTFAAHIPLTTLDIFGVSGIVLACFLSWRYFQQPTVGRLVVAALGMAFAMLLKHTAIILPGVVVLFAILWWVVKPWREGQALKDWKQDLRGRLGHLTLGAVLVPLMLWALLLFEFRKPTIRPSWETKQPTLYALLNRPMPAATYVQSILDALWHGKNGHEGYLLGEKRMNGWWYYFPVVATYKIPLGVVLILLLGGASLWWAPLRWDEWALLIPILAWTVYLMSSGMNIGFRHFLPPYLFLLLFASRCAAVRGITWAAALVIGFGATALHAASYHPDYLCYLNYPRHKAYLDISDSNVDWGQSLLQVRDWIDGHPQPRRTITLRYFGFPEIDYQRYLGDRVKPLGPADSPPTTGILIISPIFEAGTYDRSDRYAALRPHEPIAVIGHAMLVYDLDRLGGGAPFTWPAEREK